MYGCVSFYIFVYIQLFFLEFEHIDLENADDAADDGVGCPRCSYPQVVGSRDGVLESYDSSTANAGAVEHGQNKVIFVYIFMENVNIFGSLS